MFANDTPTPGYVAPYIVHARNTSGATGELSSWTCVAPTPSNVHADENVKFCWADAHPHVADGVSACVVGVTLSSRTMRPLGKIVKSLVPLIAVATGQLYAESNATRTLTMPGPGSITVSVEVEAGLPPATVSAGAIVNPTPLSAAHAVEVPI